MEKNEAVFENLPWQTLLCGTVIESFSSRGKKYHLTAIEFEIPTLAPGDSSTP